MLWYSNGTDKYGDLDVNLFGVQIKTNTPKIAFQHESALKPYHGKIYSAGLLVDIVNDFILY